MGVRLFILFFLVSFICCTSSNENDSKQRSEEPLEVSSVHYAKGFNIAHFKGYDKLTVSKSYKGNNETFEYYLTNDSSFLPAEFTGKAIITPIKSIAVLSATYIPFIRS